MFQSFNLLSRTSAIENVALPLFYAASGPAGAASRIERARASLKLLGLGDRERNTPGQLSGGQQQRVAIARALINEPGLLLADEPTGNLDTRTSHEIMETLTQLNREHGVTIIVVTHESDIAAYADRILTMRDGQIVSDVQNPKPGRTAAPAAGGVPISRSQRPMPTAARRANTFWGFALMIMAAAIQAIWRNMMRSALTMLGVFIGVAALIAMVAVGQGANDAVRKQIERLGTNLVVVLPGARTAGGMRARIRQRLHAHDQRRASNSAREHGHQRGELPHPPVRPGAIRQSELGHQHPRHQPELPADDQLADRRRTRDFAR